MVRSHEPAAIVARTTVAGIHCLPVPTPFAVGAVNAYLVDDEPLTLVDCGPNSATALAALEGLLADHGRVIADIDLVVVTHQHMDHMGLAGLVAQRSGAEIACLGLLAPYLEGWDEWSARDDDLAHDLMLRHGLEPRAAKALRSVARMVRGWGAAAHVDRPLAAGDVLRFARRTLRVLHRPGHSPSDTVLHDEERGIVIGGDHLLSRVSSNALISYPLDGSPTDGRPRPLVEYRASLLATRALDAAIVLGGHGEPVTAPASLIDERVRRQDERADHLLGLLSQGPRSAHELATSLWGDVAITQAYLTLSEVLGHVDLLIEAGRVVEDDGGPVTRFEAV
ncbi:MAG: MBL fold metallo-hydrolase [Actinobacteria bacterium]|nr:MAG: MBL fold metallo-hydrolase [Actinomycetota bacterium]